LRACFIAVAGVDLQPENAYYGVPVSVLLVARKSSAVRDGRYSA